MTNQNVSESSTGFVSRLLALCKADFVVILLFLVFLNVTLVVVQPQSVPVRIALTGPLLLFLPGYVLVTTIFPWSSLPEQTSETGIITQYCDLNGAERAGLSFGLSVILLPIFGLLIGVAQWGYTVDTVILLLSVFVALGAVASVIRRQRVPANARFRVPFKSWFGTLSQFLRAGGSLNTAVNAALIVSVALALVTVGYAFAAPQDGEQYSSLQLLTETEDGEYVTGNYPEELTAGEEEELVVAIENHEQTQTEYTVVAQVERVDIGENDTTVRSSETLWETSTTVEPGGVARTEHTISPEMTGENLRISYYLYRGDAPEPPTSESAYHHVYLWVDVNETVAG